MGHTVPAIVFALFPTRSLFLRGADRTSAHAWEVFMSMLGKSSCAAQAMATTGAQGYSQDVGWLRERKHVNWCGVVCCVRKQTNWLATYHSSGSALALIYCLLLLKCDEIQKWKWPFLNYSHQNDSGMWVLDASAQYIYSSLRQSAMLS